MHMKSTRTFILVPCIHQLKHHFLRETFLDSFLRLFLYPPVSLFWTLVTTAIKYLFVNSSLLLMLGSLWLKVVTLLVIIVPPQWGVMQSSLPRLMQELWLNKSNFTVCVSSSIEKEEKQWSYWDFVEWDMMYLIAYRATLGIYCSSCSINTTYY